MEISDKKVVKIHYKGTLSDGSVFDSSEGKEPLEFVYGMGLIIPGLEKGLEGLKKGDTKKVEVKSEDAYGPVMDEAKQEVPKSQFPPEIELQVGMQLAAQGPQGVIPVTVSEIKDESVLVDFNHPLAGKDLTFEVTVDDIRDATEEELSHGHSHAKGEEGCCGGGNCSTEKEGDDKKEGCCGGNCHN